LNTYDFDVAVTFAGEDRAYVEHVVQAIKKSGLSVFYDEDAKVEMWGEDLTEYFADVYERRARYAVMFVSVHYAAKVWTRLERRSVLLRALESDKVYLLPVRLDSTNLPGLRSSVGYLNAHTEGTAGVADAIVAKLGKTTADGERRFNGRVPRTPSEAFLLLGERPAGWEYILLSYWLSQGVEERAAAYQDHELGFALSNNYIPAERLLDYMDSELARVLSIVDVFENLLFGPGQQLAAGAPGEPGDPARIEHLASRVLMIYDELLAWSYRLRSTSTTADEGRDALKALANYATQPIDAVRAFITSFTDDMNALSGKLEAGEDVDVEMYITFEVPEEVTLNYHAAMKKLRSAL
jgi:hypothetical protein